MKKLSPEERWNLAKQIAKQLPEGTDVKNMSKADLVKYDERCNLLVEKLSKYDGKDYDEDDTLDFFLTLVSFHVAAMSKRPEYIKTCCPKCNGDQSLSKNTETGYFRCHKCGYTGYTDNNN